MTAASVPNLVDDLVQFPGHLVHPVVDVRVARAQLSPLHKTPGRSRSLGSGRWPVGRGGLGRGQADCGGISSRGDALSGAGLQTPVREEALDHRPLLDGGDDVETQGSCQP